MKRPVIVVVVAVLVGCRPNYSPDTYASSAVQQANKVEQGVVVGVRMVDVQASGTTGAVTGAAAGGLVGNSVPGGGVGSALTTLGGSLVGGLVGTGVERATGNTTAFEYIVRKGNNDLVSVTQRDAVALELGAKVLVIAGSQARIVPDYTKPEVGKPEAGKPEVGQVEGAPAVLPPVASEPIAPPAPRPSFTPIL